MDLSNEGAQKQIKEFGTLACEFGVPLMIVGSHTCHSRELPVVQLKIANIDFYLRDNWYDINLCAISPNPFTLTPSELLDGVVEPHDWNWYLEEISRCRGYTWDYFTDEEMEDPRILRVVNVPHKLCPERTITCNVTGEEKNRWLKRMTDPEWWEKNWSSGKICWDGDFGPGVKLYIQGRPYLEGIHNVVKYGQTEFYKQGCTSFALAVGELDKAKSLIKKLVQNQQQ